MSRRLVQTPVKITFRSPILFTTICTESCSLGLAYERHFSLVPTSVWSRLFSVSLYNGTSAMEPVFHQFVLLDFQVGHVLTSFTIRNKLCQMMWFYDPTTFLKLSFKTASLDYILFAVSANSIVLLSCRRRR